MCEICHQNPCHPQCPNATPIVIGYCEECGEEIEQGYEAYKDMNDFLYCSVECAIRHNEIHEITEQEVNDLLS